MDTVKGHKVHVDRIVTVADPGQVMDPGITRAGLEGGDAGLPCDPVPVSIALGSRTFRLL